MNWLEAASLVLVFLGTFLLAFLVVKQVMRPTMERLQREAEKGVTTIGTKDKIG